MPRPDLAIRVLAVRYACALGSAAAALTLRWLLLPVFGRPVTLAVIFPAIAASTRFLGIGPGIVTVIAGAAGIITITGDRDLVRLGIYLVISSLTVFLTGAWAQARSQAAENLARREREERFSAQLRAIVESSEDAVISKDLDGRIRSWNRAAERIFGYTAEEAIGCILTALLPAERSNEEAEITGRIRRGEHVKQFETERVRKDGAVIQVALTVSPVYSSAGEMTGVSHIARDVGERKAFEAQLRQTQKLESLGVLVGGLAHDFNNLLTGIMGNASLVRNDLRTGSPSHHRMTEILQASEKAALLIRQMLAYAGKGRFVVEKLNLSDQVSDTLPILRNSVPRNVNFELHLERDLPAIEADRSQIQQLIMNLALNAAEATPNDSGTVSIATSFRSNHSASEVLLEVSDNGCGISEEAKDRIFDPFFTTKFTGRGLGLAAVMGIIRTHGGTIAVDSVPGHGSKFTVVLPAVTATEASAVSNTGRSRH